jgi:hypothetical protein
LCFDSPACHLYRRRLEKRAALQEAVKPAPSADDADDRDPYHALMLSSGPAMGRKTGLIG